MLPVSDSCVIKTTQLASAVAIVAFIEIQLSWKEKTEIWRTGVSQRYPGTGVWGKAPKS